MAAASEKARRRWFRDHAGSLRARPPGPGRLPAAVGVVPLVSLQSAQRLDGADLSGDGSGAAFVLMFLWLLAALVFRLRFQVSILALLLLVVVVAVPFSWLATEMEKAREQREVVEWLEKLNGGACYL